MNITKQTKLEKLRLIQEILDRQVTYADDSDLLVRMQKALLRLSLSTLSDLSIITRAIQWDAAASAKAFRDD